MIIQYKPGHFIDFSNVAEVQFHETSFSLHMKTVGCNSFAHIQYDPDDFYSLRDKYMLYVESHNAGSEAFSEFKQAPKIATVRKA